MCKAYAGTIIENGMHACYNAGTQCFYCAIELSLTVSLSPHGAGRM